MSQYRLELKKYHPYDTTFWQLLAPDGTVITACYSPNWQNIVNELNKLLDKTNSKQNSDLCGNTSLGIF